MSESEKTLIQKARELAKLEKTLTKAKAAEDVRRAEAMQGQRDLEDAITAVKGEIAALVAPPKG